MITVDIVDDHAMVVEGLVKIIEGSGIARVGATYGTLALGREGLRLRRPDVLLLDLGLPDGSGVDLCAELKKAWPELKILVLTSFREVNVARRVLDGGASGYVLKNALADELIEAIGTVADGGTYLCDPIGAMLRKRKNEQAVWLTGREKQVLGLIAEGLSNVEIAAAIHLSVDTVKGYRKNLLLKFGARNTAAMIRAAIGEGLV